ncbi:MAG: rhodanese-like domain-containing protein [Actinomycetes bacterium]|jgi:rhodanese-related sulfurtransferase
MKEISVQELKTILGEVSLVDVREPDEYLEAHVPGANLISLASVPIRNDELDKSQPQYIICKSGVRSAKAAEFLISQGFDAINITGGTMAWIDAGEPVHTGDQP